MIKITAHFPEDMLLALWPWNRGPMKIWCSIHMMFEYTIANCSKNTITEYIEKVNVLSLLHISGLSLGVVDRKRYVTHFISGEKPAGVFFVAKTCGRFRGFAGWSQSHDSRICEWQWWHRYRNTRWWSLIIGNENFKVLKHTIVAHSCL